MTAPKSVSTPATCAQAWHGVCCTALRRQPRQSRCLSKPSLRLLPAPGDADAPAQASHWGTDSPGPWAQPSYGQRPPEVSANLTYSFILIKDWKPCLPPPSTPKMLFLHQLPGTQQAQSCTHAAGCTGHGPETSRSTRLKGMFATTLAATKVKTQIKASFYVHQNTTHAHEDVVLHWFTAVNGLTTWKYTSVLGSRVI